jgi:hypothetical protein
MTIGRTLKSLPYTNFDYLLLKFCNLLDQLTIARATTSNGEVACDFLSSMPNSFASLIMEQTNRVETMQEVIGLLFKEGMKRKNDKNEEDNGSLGAFYGSTSKIIDVGYMDTLQRNVWHHNLLKKTMLCNKPS